MSARIFSEQNGRVKILITGILGIGQNKTNERAQNDIRREKEDRRGAEGRVTQKRNEKE